MSLVEMVEGFANFSSTHSILLPCTGHQSKYAVESDEFAGSSPSMMLRAFLPRPFGNGDAVISAVVTTVGNGVGFAAVSTRASHTAICPRPRFAHVAYGIAMNGCSLRVMLPFASNARPDARPLITSTPFNRSRRNSAVSALLSGNTMFLTLPFG